MVVPVLLILVVAFLLLFVLRVGGAQRRALLARWPAVLFALAAGLALMRGAIWPALAFGAFAALAWIVWPSFNRAIPKAAPAAPTPDPADISAAAILGVRPGAPESDIRAAYRAKMASAHPDRGGTNAEAARLTAARDRLLRKRG